MKRIVLISFLASVLLTGCGGPVSEMDAAQITAVVQEYYQAFNTYDIERLEALYAEETWKEEGWKIRALVPWAKQLNVTSEFVSLKSIRGGGDAAEITVQVMSNLMAGEDCHRLVRNDNGWEITGPLNVQVDQFSVSYTKGPPSSCTGSACCP